MIMLQGNVIDLCWKKNVFKIFILYNKAKVPQSMRSISMGALTNMDKSYEYYLSSNKLNWNHR